MSAVPQSRSISNADFLRGVFHEFADEAHVCGFEDAPDAIPNERRGLCWKGRRFKQRDLNPSHNNYFVISTFEMLNENGALRAVRRKAQFLQGHCVVVDDVGTKVKDTERLPPPSWRLETSPGNEQWGYILDKPCTDGALFSGTLALMVAKGLSVDGTDPGMKGVTRYVRLPVGVNRKSKYAPMGFVCNLQEWAPERTYSLARLLAEFDATEDDARALAEGVGSGARVAAPDDDIKLKALDAAGLYKRPIAGKPGWHEIECPWLETHSDGDDSGTAVFTGERGYGFKCHHGHCEEKTFNDVDNWLKEHNVSPFDEVEVKEAEKPLTRVAEGHTVLPLSWEAFDMLGLPPARKWLVDEWIGIGHITSLYGRGGVGKSLLSLQLGIAVAKGEPLFGLNVTKGRVLGLYCEDDIDEIWRRAYNIVGGEGFAGLEDRFVCDARVGRDNVLIEEAKKNRVVATDFYWHLDDKLANARAVGDPFTLVILDNISQMMAIPENERPPVTQAVNMLNHLAHAHQCAVLLLGHTAKLRDSEFSGSTAWENAVRARLLFERNEENNDDLTLAKAKANYSRLDALSLAYRAGKYIRTDGLMSEITPDEQAERERLEDNAVIDALIKYHREGTSVTNEDSSTTRYLWKRMVKDDITQGMSERTIRAALARLIDRKVIIVNNEWRDAYRRKGRELLLADKEMFE